MTVYVELFGIPRERAGRSHVEVETEDAVVRLGDVLLDLAARYPALAQECFQGDQLREGYVANLRGDEFVTAPDTKLRSGDSLLILSADAGG